MPSPDSDASARMDALSAAIARLVRAHQETDRRLAEIEKHLGIVAAAVPKPPPPVPEPEPTPSAPPLLEAAPAISAISARPQPPQPPRLETNLGLKWINRIGAITLALCVAFVFKYAVDNAWIGPAGRVALGVLAGLAALAVADYTWRGGQKIYAQGISGLGLAVLYLSFYAAFGFYHLVGSAIAFALLASATAMAGAAALRYDAPAIAALGLLGGYATPILLSTGEDRPWVLFSWVLLLNGCALAAARLRKWGKLEASGPYSHRDSVRRMAARPFRAREAKRRRPVRVCLLRLVRHIRVAANLLPGANPRRNGDAHNLGAGGGAICAPDAAADRGRSRNFRPHAVA